MESIKISNEGFEISQDTKTQEPFSWDDIKIMEKDGSEAFEKDEERRNLIEKIDNLQIEPGKQLESINELRKRICKIELCLFGSVQEDLV